MKYPKSVYFSVFLLCLGMISIQAGASLAKQLFPVLGAEGATLARLILASAILIGIWRPWRHRPSRSEFKSVFVYGLSLGFMNLLFYMALAHIPLGIAVACEFSGPLVVALFSSRKPADFIWALFAIGGVLMISPIADFSGNINAVGVTYALGAGLFWALYIIYGQKAGSTVHEGYVTSMGMLIATIVVIPFGIASAGTSLLNWKILPIALVVAILSSAFPYTLEMITMKRMPTKTFSILMSMEPALAALSGLIFLKEYLTLQQIVAIGLIIIASVGVSATYKEKLINVPAS